MTKPLQNCPVCDGTLRIRELKCGNCETRLISDFELTESPLAVSDEILNFIKVFIYAEGSIKQSEKLLNCSYPKIKNLLKKTRIALGLNEDTPKQKQVVIEQLDRGEITVQEALKQLGASESEN